jgi:hypothetical protein
VAGIDQANFQSGRFQNLEEWDPVNAGRFHRDGFHVAKFEPVAQGKQIVGKGGEGADRFFVCIERHGHLDGFGADVDAGGVRVEGGHLRIGFGADFFAR